MASRQEDIRKIDRFIKGEGTESEEAYVKSFFLQGEENLYLRQGLEKDWNSIVDDSSKPEADLSHLLDRIHHKIRIIEAGEKRKPLKRFIRAYSKIAASMFIPLLLGGIAYWGFTNQQKPSKVVSQEVSATIFAPMGSRVSFNLPDGTKGVLNSGSKLSYNMPFGEKRNLKLEGEAWFEVKHDEAHPFIINTGNSTVKVFGTSFNLSSYPEDHYLELVLKEGKVNFIGPESANEISMVPSERLVLAKGKIQRTMVSPEKYKSWVDGKLVFRNDSIAEVARRMERWYNVKITIADRALDCYSFHATFQDDKLEDVLKYLAMSSPISYRIIPRKLLEDGTLKKEEVIIYKNRKY